MAFLDLQQGILEEFVSLQHMFGMTSDGALFRWYMRRVERAHQWNRDNPEKRREHVSKYQSNMTEEQQEQQRAVWRKASTAYKMKKKQGVSSDKTNDSRKKKERTPVNNP